MFSHSVSSFGGKVLVRFFSRSSFTFVLIVALTSVVHSFFVLLVLSFQAKLQNINPVFLGLSSASELNASVSWRMQYVKFPNSPFC